MYVANIQTHTANVVNGKKKRFLFPIFSHKCLAENKQLIHTHIKKEK